MFSFQGRSTRAQFSEIVVADIVFVAVVLGGYWWVTTKMGGLGAIPMEVMAVVLFVFCALVVPLFVATLATAVRRFHDRGKSGWWALSLLVVYGFLEGMFAKGTEGSNEYGDSTATLSPAMQRAMPRTPVAPQTEVKKEPAQAPLTATVPTTPSPAPAPAQPATPLAQKPAPTPVQTAPVPPVQAKPTPTPASTPTPAPQAQVPPARSMSEMLAELQKLSEQENSFAAKVPPKPVAPVASAPSPTVTPPQPKPAPTPAPTPAPATPPMPAATAPKAPVAQVVPQTPPAATPPTPPSAKTL